VWVIFLRAGAVLPFIAILGESGPLFEVRWDVKRFEGLFKRVTPCHVGAAQRPGVRHPSGQEFARYAVSTTGTYVVAWPQGDQLGGGLWRKEILPAAHWFSLDEGGGAPD